MRGRLATVVVPCLGTVLLLPLLACGGGGGGEPPPTVLSGVSTSIGGLDGWVWTDGSFNALDVPRAGDLDLSAPGQRITACYSFDVGLIPAGATIRDATLRVYVVGHAGDPYLEHGTMEAHYLPYGDSLANAGMIAVFDPPPAAPFSPSSVAAGEKAADVRALLQRAVDDGTTRLQVQVGFLGQFALVNGIDDTVTLTDGEGSVAGGALPSLSFSWFAP